MVKKLQTTNILKGTVAMVIHLSSSPIIYYKSIHAVSNHQRNLELKRRCKKHLDGQVGEGKTDLTLANSISMVPSHQ
jgi:hypothetical protein